MSSTKHDRDYLVGTSWFVLGKYDPGAGTFTNVVEAQPLESSKTVIWSTVGRVADGRTLHLGWNNFGAGNANCLTAPREITYDAQRQKLLAMPIAELAKLRGQTLANVSSSVTIGAGSSHAVFGTPLPPGQLLLGLTDRSRS